jgi:hypothetical protein
MINSKQQLSDEEQQLHITESQGKLQLFEDLELKFLLKEMA